MSYFSFSIKDILPQEEKLAVFKSKSELFIGIPKETSYQEHRICLTPMRLALWFVMDTKS